MLIHVCGGCLAVTLSKANCTIFLQRLHLLPLKILCILASRVLRPKKERIKHLFCRWTAVWPCGIFLGRVSGVGLR